MFMFVLVFFFNDTATTEIYTLSLHDALPIWSRVEVQLIGRLNCARNSTTLDLLRHEHQIIETMSLRLSSLLFVLTTSTLDRKSTRLNSSHANISYAVFCLKKKKIRNNQVINP